jgi:hypothetical protein
LQYWGLIIKIGGRESLGKDGKVKRIRRSLKFDPPRLSDRNDPPVTRVGSNYNKI